MVVLQLFAVFMGCAGLFWVLQLSMAYLDRRRQHSLLPAYGDSAGDPVGVSVVIPAYNEHPAVLDRCVKHVLNSIGVLLQLIVVDDGSATPVEGVRWPTDLVQVVRVEHGGKRKAQSKGFELARHPWIVTIDSDTYIERHAILNLLKAALASRASAVTGTVKLSNEKKNILTRIAGMIYWYAYFQERAAQSFLGCVTCCSGALSLYDAVIVKEQLAEYQAQCFRGQPVLAGDDRFMTTLFLLSGHRVVWTPWAIGITTTPERFRDFLKQQLRWTRSFIATMPYLIDRIEDWSLSFAFFNLRHLYRFPYHIFVLLTTAWVCLVHLSVWPLLILLGGIALVAAIKAAVAAIYTKDLTFFGIVPYSILAFGVMSYILTLAMLTPHKTGWTTR